MGCATSKNIQPHVQVPPPKETALGLHQNISLPPDLSANLKSGLNEKNQEKLLDNRGGVISNQKTNDFFKIKQKFEVKPKRSTLSVQDSKASSMISAISGSSSRRNSSVALSNYSDISSAVAAGSTMVSSIIANDRSTAICNTMTNSENSKAEGSKMSSQIISNIDTGMGSNFQEQKSKTITSTNTISEMSGSEAGGTKSQVSRNKIISGVSGNKALSKVTSNSTKIQASKISDNRSKNKEDTRRETISTVFSQQNNQQEQKKQASKMVTTSLKGSLPKKTD